MENGPAISELDEAWELALAEAKRRAQATGRSDITDYLNLRTRNDLLRKIGIEWLLNSFTNLAGEANRRGAAIQLEHLDAHRFRVGTATMVGTRLTLRNGVRTLSIESGWPRAPRDGFIRGGGLACANLKHFGRPRSNAELTLKRSSKNSPQWVIAEKTGAQSLLSEKRLRDHLFILLEGS